MVEIISTSPVLILLTITNKVILAAVAVSGRPADNSPPPGKMMGWDGMAKG